MGNSIILALFDMGIPLVYSMVDVELISNRSLFL